MLASGDAVVVYGGGTASCPPQPGVTFQIATGASLSLNNGGDTVTVADGGGIVLATYTWGAGEADNNQSIVLDPELDSAGPYIEHSAAPGSIGNFSPGTRADGTPL